MFHPYAVIEALRTVQPGIVYGYELSPAVQYRRTAASRERRNRIHQAVFCPLAYHAAVKLRLHALFRNGKCWAEIEANHV